MAKAGRPPGQVKPQPLTVRCTICQKLYTETPEQFDARIASGLYPHCSGVCKTEVDKRGLRSL